MGGMYILSTVLVSDNNIEERNIVNSSQRGLIF